MGGTSAASTDKYSLMQWQVLRRISVVWALFIILYGIAAELNWVSRSPLYTSLNTLIICSVVVLLAVTIYYKPLNSNTSRLTWFVIPFHTLGILLPICLTGFLNPVTVFWVILIAVTGMFFGRLAIMFSGAVLFITSLVMIAIGYHPGSLINGVMAMNILSLTIVIIILSCFVYSLHQVRQSEHEDHVVSEQKRTYEQNRLLTLINSLNEAVISINAKGVVQLYNAATLNLLDTNQSLTGRKIDDVLPLTTESDSQYQLFEELERGSPTLLRNDLIFRFEDGETINVAISSSRVRDRSNEIVGYIIVLRDITREKSLDEERDEFISVVSHELRTPITITEGTISNAKMLIAKGASPKVVADALGAAHEQTLYLARIINDLSTLSRAERGVGSEKERINVQQFVHEIYKDFQPKVAQKKLAFNLDISGNPGYVKVSRLYLEEILQNFLTNAIKYTPSGSIDFIVKVINSQVVFAVKDTGIGISKKEHKKVFDKFYRSEDYRTRETNGTGLGLYIVQKLARKVDTKVEIVSSLNQGSTFSVRIPLTTSVDNNKEER